MFLQLSDADSLLGLGMFPLLKTKLVLCKLLNADTQALLYSLLSGDYEKVTNIERVSAHILARPAAFWSSVGDLCWCGAAEISPEPN